MAGVIDKPRLIGYVAKRSVDEANMCDRNDDDEKHITYNNFDDRFKMKKVLNILDAEQRGNSLMLT